MSTPLDLQNNNGWIEEPNSEHVEKFIASRVPTLNVLFIQSYLLKIYPSSNDTCDVTFHDSHLLSARWRSGWRVRFAVGRPGVHFFSRVIPKDFKNGIQRFPAWRSA